MYFGRYALFMSKLNHMHTFCYCLRIFLHKGSLRPEKKTDKIDVKFAFESIYDINLKFLLHKLHKSFESFCKTTNMLETKLIFLFQ